MQLNNKAETEKDDANIRYSDFGEEVVSPAAGEGQPFKMLESEQKTGSVEQLPYSYAKRNGVLIDLRDTAENKVSVDTKVVLCSDTPPLVVVNEIQRYIDLPVHFRVVGQQMFETILETSFQNQSSEAMEAAAGIGDELDLASLAEQIPETEDLLEQEDDAPIIRLINAILTEAIRNAASDIHIETFEKRLVVRMRIDGVLREVLEPRRALAPLLVSRIKVMSKMDIAEKRVPQDGRIALKIGGREIDIRVSTMPSSNGERVVLRLLDKQAGRLDLTHLGMAGKDLKLLQESIFKPHGIILVTGPTGSGKTTTLYASLSKLNDKSRNILTVEDPIEYKIEGIGQTQVNTKVDMTFARGLRAILRQDPDVVMIGEIRDLETAEIAVQASLTGHLVLSTLHTNSAIGAVTRLQDMGVEPFLLASSLVAVVAQRLVRVLCDECKIARKPTEKEYQALGVKPEKLPYIYAPVGCKNCNHLGYRGRVGIYELLVFDETLRKMVHEGESESSIEAYARKHHKSIRVDGIRKVAQGKTTLEEVLRVTRDG